MPRFTIDFDQPLQVQLDALSKPSYCGPVRWFKMESPHDKWVRELIDVKRQLRSLRERMPKCATYCEVPNVLRDVELMLSECRVKFQQANSKEACLTEPPADDVINKIKVSVVLGGHNPCIHVAIPYATEDKSGHIRLKTFVSEPRSPESWQVGIVDALNAMSPGIAVASPAQPPAPPPPSDNPNPPVPPSNRGVGDNQS